MADVFLVTADVLRRLKALEEWKSSFSIKGPNVRINRTGNSFSAFVGAPDNRANNDSTPQIVVKITATKGAGGQYDGSVMGGTLTLDGTGTYSLPGALTVGDSVLVVNDDEAGNSTHWVELNSFAEGVFDGQSTEGTPRPIVRIQRAKYRTASPTTLGSSSERTSASGSTWNRTTSDAPLELWVGTGAYYDSAAGTPALKQHMVKATFAADGRLHSVSGETDYIIDTPDDACA